MQGGHMGNRRHDPEGRRTQPEDGGMAGPGRLDHRESDSALIFLAVVPCLLYFGVWVSGRLCILLPGLATSAFLSDRPRSPLVAFAVLVVMLLVLRRRTLAPLVGARRYETGRSLVMAMLGAPLTLIVILPLLLLFGWLSGKLGTWPSRLMELVVYGLSGPAMGFWSGWRVGRWGYRVGVIVPGLWYFALFAFDAQLLTHDWPWPSMCMMLFLVLGGYAGERGAEIYRWSKARRDAEIERAMRGPSSADLVGR